LRCVGIALLSRLENARNVAHAVTIMVQTKGQLETTARMIQLWEIELKTIRLKAA